MKKLLFVILALVTVIALASCGIDGILGTGTNQGDSSYAEDENQNSEDDGEGTDPDDNEDDLELDYSEGLRYTLDTNGTSYTVIGIGTCTDKDIEIPATYNGKPVTSIGNRAFKDCFGLKSITIPDSVTSIGDSAFYDCTSLASVTIGNSVTSIGDAAFSYCTSLANVTIGNSVTSIGNYAFYDCRGLTSVTIPDSVTSIAYGALSQCSSLTAVYYAGTEAEWSKISIDYNYDLEIATRYYYSETEPTVVGNYWRYDENGEVAVW